MSISDGLDPYIFRRNMGKMRSMKEEVDGDVFNSRQSWHFFKVNMNKVLFPICTLNWRVNNYVSRQRKDVNRRNGNNCYYIDL